MPLKKLTIAAVEALARKRNRTAYLMYLTALRYIQVYDNADTDMWSNGELRLQKQVGQAGATTVFDVGANQGDWTKAMLEASRSAQIYCFEAVPATFAKLRANVTDERCRLINEALSSEQGTLEFNATRDLDHVSSVYDVTQFDTELKVEKLQIPASTGDARCASLGVTHIDFLKIDTEGHDIDVLKGFTQMIGKGGVDLIQFEYNYFTLLARRSLLDFYHLLGEQYLICRLLPDSLEVLAYERSLDNFAPSNWVAVRRAIVDEKLVKAFGIKLGHGWRRDWTVKTMASEQRILSLIE